MGNYEFKFRKSVRNFASDYDSSKALLSSSSVEISSTFFLPKALYSLTLSPVTFLKLELKALLDWNPTDLAIQSVE